MKEDFIKNLIRILERSDIDSVHLSTFWGKNKIKLSKQSTLPATTSISSPPISTTIVSNDGQSTDTDRPSSETQHSNNNLNKVESIDEGNVETSSSNLHYITAPLVGTFYVSPKPGEPPFIKVGDKIEAGNIICIIEAMKIFNEIESDINGTVKEVLIDDSSPVEYGQKIISVEVDD